MFNFREQYKKHENLIYEEIVAEFGEYYREVVFSRLSNLYIFFQSNPEEDYVFMRNNEDMLSFDEKLKIERNNKAFKRAKIKEKEKLQGRFIKVIQDDFGIGIEFEESLIKCAFLFSDQNFGASYIDSFSSDSIQLLSNNNIPQSVKDNIKDEQWFVSNTLKEVFGIDEPLSSIAVARFLEKRKNFQETYYHHILEYGLPYNMELIQFFKQFVSNIDWIDLFNIAFYLDAFHRRFYSPDVNGFISYISFPIIRLKNQGNKGVDVALIHELLHKITVPHADYFGFFKMIDEINIQRHAINIVRRLHEKQIFIFDNSKDCEITGTSQYEIMFPLVDEFLAAYENNFSRAMLIDGYAILANYFGDIWNSFAIKINKLYESVQKVPINYNVCEHHSSAELLEMIKTMELNYRHYSSMGR